jgi:hypothetical protein
MGSTTAVAASGAVTRGGFLHPIQQVLKLVRRKILEG